MAQIIKCPHCQQEVEISEALAAQLKDRWRDELKGELTREAKAKLAIEIAGIKEEAEEATKKLAQYQKKELELRKEKRALEERHRTMELEITRQLDEERKKVEESVLKRAAQEHRLKELEMAKQLEDQKRLIEELKHKTEIGSQQNRGEVIELDLENILRQQFTGDDITAVGKGVLGADIIQHVRNRDGKLCEKIVWESKRTRHWSDQWLEKLKDNSRKMNGFVSVIVTQTLPVDVTGFNYYKGVWVTDYDSVVGLATALRMQIIHVCYTRDSMAGKGEKMEMLYDYLTSHQFRQRVGAIVETYRNMRLDLVKEKESLRRLWSKREKEIERLAESTVTMYGDMQGLIGSGMLTIPALELGEEVEEAKEDDQDQATIVSLPLN